MAGAVINITDAGRAALVANGNTGTNAHQVVSIGIANAPFNAADKSLIALPNEYKRITTFGGKNIAADMLHITLQDNTDDQYTMFGFGLYLEDGTLLGVYSQATAIMEKSPLSILLLSTDIQVVSIDAAQITFGNTEFINPPATVDALGVVQLATQQEVNAGADAAKVLTAKTAATRYAALSGALFTGNVQAPSITSTGIARVQTPPAGDSSNAAATTEWVTAAVSSMLVGTLVFEARATVRAGCLRLNGALVNRADYPALWAYAQASGNIVAESAWSTGNSGAFSSGDGGTTFRLPDFRGEFPRFFDDARGVDAGRKIGAFQASQNLSHTHAATVAAGGDHTHTAYTDSQGWHGHNGTTYAIGDHQHVLDQPVPQYVGDTDRGSNGSNFSIDTGARYPVTSWGGAHAHGFDTNGAGTHGHNVGVNGVAAHVHTATISADGGTESRPRNVALLAMIRAY
jgi:microcystin-dependent protein